MPFPALPQSNLHVVYAKLHDLDDLPKVSTSTVIGITVAVAGNVLISLALNIQKLAHLRVEANKAAKVENDHAPSLTAGNGQQSEVMNRVESSGGSVPSETRPLVSSTYGGAHRDYGTPSTPKQDRPRPLPWGPSLRLSPQLPSTISEQENAPEALQQQASVILDVPVVDLSPHHLNPESGKKSPSPSKSSETPSQGNESDYLRSKLWWLGFCLMNIGECGNFISYGFAPASVVAPLGTFALIANCVFAPLMLAERFRKRDLLGIFIAIVGAVTVVLSANSSEARLDADGLLRAIAQLPFIIYSCIYIAGVMFLGTISQGILAKRWVFIDVGLCALFGGFTVLSTKAVSTLLTLEGFNMFTNWITYPVILILALTGVGQIRYLNRALMNFDSKVVIPIQFVLFNLSAIVGSAILFGDFRKAKFHQVVTFLYGCAATFCGVFVIAWSPSSDDSEYDEDVPVGTVSHDMPYEDSTTLGSLNRQRATLIMPNVTKSAPVLRSKRSTVSLLGLSPAHHLLLVHSPPRETPERCHDTHSDADPLNTPDSPYRRRAISWLGDQSRSGTATRDSSLIGRRVQRSGTCDGVTKAGRSPNDSH